MKNVRPWEQVSCICKTFGDFVLDVQKALDDPDATVDLDGSIHSSSAGDDLRRLAGYYGIKGEITSIHTDNSEYCGVWIAYKEAGDVMKERKDTAAEEPCFRFTKHWRNRRTGQCTFSWYTAMAWAEAGDDVEAWLPDGLSEVIPGDTVPAQCQTAVE